MYFNYLEKADPEICAAIKREMNRQENKIEMIASENFVNYEVMEAADKYTIFGRVSPEQKAILVSAF